MALELTKEQIEAGWTLQKLGNITTKIGSGATPRGGKSVYIDDGAALVRSQNVYDHELIFEGVARIDEDAEKQLRNVKIQDCDILLNITGDSIARCAYVKPVVEDAYVNQHVCIVRVDSAKADYLYIQKYLAGALGKKRLLDMSDGATRRALTKKALEEFEITLPPLEEQNRVAEILGSLDDKIEANNALNTSLRELFKLRFSSLVEESSREFMLTDMAEFINGKAFTKGASGTGRMVIRIAELNGGPGASTVYNEIDVDSKHEANPGDILMSWSGSLGVFLWSREQAIINQHIFKVIPKSGFSKAVIFCALENVIDDFRSIALEKATTMGHIKRGDLEKTVRIPTYNAELEVILNQICVLEQENLALADTRDLLIRKLIK